MAQDLLKLNSDVIHRRANGKTIWQPRIACWYDDRRYRGEALEDGYDDCKSIAQLYTRLGCSNRLYDFNSCLKVREARDVIRSTERIDEKRVRHTVTTPEGTATAVYATNTSNPGQMPVKWWIEDEDDLKVFSYIEETTEYYFDYELYDTLYKELSALGLPIMFLPRTNIQNMFVNTAGVENSIYLLADSRDEVEAYFDCMSRGQQRFIKAVADSPLEWVNYGDNIHCKILPPELFERYILPEYEKRGALLHAAGKFIHSHWDGDTRDILKYAKTCYLDGIEAITPKPQGDVTLEEVKAALGDEIFLIDGAAAVLFSDLYPVEMLDEQIDRLLELFEGQLVLGISDEFPSDGRLERILRVGEKVEKFNASR